MTKSLTAGLVLAAVLGVAAIALPVRADNGTITINVAKPGAAIPATLYGLMTEEINYSYDGGLYGELVQNRIFQNTIAAGRGGGARGRGPATNPASGPASAPAPVAPPVAATPGPGSLAHWSEFQGAKIALDQSNPVNTGALKTSARVDISAPGGGIANDGFWGIPVRPNNTYRANFYARAGNGFSGPVTVSIVGDNGTIYATAISEPVGDQWKHYTLTLKTGQTPATAAAKFVITGNTPGSVWLSLVSLFPPTFHDRVNGFRPDLMQLLDDMHPSFLRFPGGNYLEGQTFADRFNWKITIGNYSERPGHNSPWRYRSSDGMGVLEFLEWCEDLKMEPVLAVFAGYTLDRQTVPASDYPIYAQEAVEEIEYVTGDVTTKWGAQRAKDGHPEPFKLRYVEIGNEDNLGAGGTTYNARFNVINAAIKAKYPQLKTISSAGTNRITGQQPDLQDEHHYPNNIQASLNLANSFDNRPRNGVHVFVGEWATRLQNLPTPNFNAAMCDAAFMCGVERNADLVEMFCYAPLLVNVNPGGQQWAGDMIGYDTLTSFGSPAYYIERMYYPNKGDVILPIAVSGATGMYTSSSRDNASGDIILKVVNTTQAAQPMAIHFDGAPFIGAKATGEVLSGTGTEVNTIAAPMNCAPKPINITDAKSDFAHEFPAMSVSVIRFKTK